MPGVLHAEKDLNASIAWVLGVVVKNTAPDPRDPSVILRAGARWTAGRESFWRDPATFQSYQDSARRGGSENWPLMAMAAKLLLGTAAEKADADRAAVAWLNEQKTQRGWMGVEVGSRVYGWMHLEAALIFMREGSSALWALAGEWLDLWMLWMRNAYESRLRRVLWLGQRSCLPGRDQPALEDDLAAWINGAAAFPTQGGTIDRLIIYALRPQLEAARQRPAANPAWKTATPVDLYAGSDGVAVRVEAEVDANTPPVLGASTVGGALAWAPRLPWANFHEQATGGRCIAVAGALTYNAAKVYKPTTLRLPASARVIRLGSGTLASAPAASVSVVPLASPPPPPVEPANVRHGSGCALTVALLAAVATVAGILIVAWHQGFP